VDKQKNIKAAKHQVKKRGEMLPKVKKKITGFLLSEEGRMPKQSIMALGSLISSAVIGGILATKSAGAQTAHVNSLTIDYTSPTATASHTHHASHSSHNSHSSHDSHSSHSSHSSTGCY
jgi:hypothetical protein